MVGYMYNAGQGVKKDYKKAFEWSLLAGEKNEAYSQVILGDLYSQGNGVKKDLIRAYAWYSLAVTNDVDSASEKLNALEDKLSEEEIKEAEALKLLKEKE